MIKIKNGLLFQWDSNRSLEIDDEKERISEIHFAHEKDEEALIVPFVREQGKVEVMIPNILLQSSEMISVFLISYEKDEIKTFYTSKLCVIEKQKPADYFYEETEVLTYEELKERIAQIGEALTQKADLVDGKLPEGQLPETAVTEETVSSAVNEALERAKDNGEFNGEDGYTPVKGVDYFTEQEVSEIVDTVAGQVSGNTFLLQGAYSMYGTQTVALSQGISSQPSGIVLVFSLYDSTNKVTLNDGINFAFVPKSIVSILGGAEVPYIFNLCSSKFADTATKKLYFTDNQIIGSSDNNDWRFVLRYVIGV